MAAGQHTCFARMLYIDTDGHGQGTWAEVEAVEDCNVPDSIATGEIKNRQSRYTRHAPGMVDHSIECTLTYDSGDADVTAIETAYHARGRIGVAEKDGAITTSGTQGYEGDYLVAEFALQIGDNDSVAKYAVRFVPDADRATAAVKPSFATTA